MNRSFFILAVLIVASLLFVAWSPDVPTFFSRMDGAFESTDLWAQDNHDGPSQEQSPGCEISGKSEVFIADSTLSMCDHMLVGGSAILTISPGGMLRINGDFTLSENAKLVVKDGGQLIVGGRLTLKGKGNTQLDGDLTVWGNIKVDDQARACGKGSVKAGGAVSGMGWCLDLSVLPIEVIWIDARLSQNENVQLTWSSEMESENDVFVVHRSTNGMSFEEVGRLKGTADATSTPRYELTDEKLRPGLYYYRIEQLNQDGELEASDLITATIERNDETGVCDLDVDPNPCVPSCTVTLTDCPGSVFRTYVTDGAGRLVSELIPLNTRDKERTIQYHLNKNNFAMPGVYIVRAESDETEVSKKLIIN